MQLIFILAQSIPN